MTNLSSSILFAALTVAVAASAASGERDLPQSLRGHRHHSPATSEHVKSDEYRRLEPSSGLVNKDFLDSGIDCDDGGYKCQTTTGTHKVLVVRVKANDASPTVTKKELEESIFGADAPSLASQYGACSRGKLNLVKAPAGATGGTDEIVEAGFAEIQINVDVQGSSKYDLESEARSVVGNKFGAWESWTQSSSGDWLPRIYGDLDHVVFLMPHGSFNYGGSDRTDWKAYATTNGFASFFNDDKITNLQTLMHEVGHNFGLDHSGDDKVNVSESQKSYFDATGYMGLYSSSTADDDIQKCFNAQKSYQLGWYANQVKSVDPLKELAGGPKTYAMIGVVSYTDEDNGKYVSLELAATDSETDGKFYVGYNRAKDYTTSCGPPLGCVGTEDRDRAMVLEQNSTDGASWKRHTFSDAGDTYGIENFGGTETTVTVKLVSVSSDLDEIAIELSIPVVAPQCEDQKFKKKCKTVEGCMWESGKCRVAPNCGAVTSKGNRKCQKTEGCTWRKKECQVAKPTSECKKKTKKKQCKRAGCVWKKNKEECKGRW